MIVRRLLLICLFNLLFVSGLFAQNLFQEKIDICGTAKYCMDCGTLKATCDSFTLAGISDRINYRYNLKGGAGSITFQVLVFGSGLSCVLSHTDGSHSPLTNELIVGLNTCLWKPAIVDGKPVNASVNVIFSIAYGKISGRMLRMDLEQLKPADSAIVYNKQFNYRNPTLSNYTFTNWNRYNSPLPDNIGQASLIDQTDVLWYASAHGISLFDGKNFIPVNEANSPLAATTIVQAIAMDKDNNKWLYANKGLYMYNNTGWQVFDTLKMGIPKPYRIVTTASGEVMFPNSKGLLILRSGKIRLIDNNLIDKMPSNDVHYAYYDTKGRLWIGTSSGSLMVDKNQKVTAFNNSRSPLANTCITNVAEDEHGNLYFTMTACHRPAGENDEEGIAVMGADGKWAHYNDKNSGMPANQVNHILYDKFEHVLWIATAKAGLVRFDLKDGWENYHNNNSAVPGPEIFQVMQDSKGAVYATTGNGLFRIVKNAAGSLQ